MEKNYRGATAVSFGAMFLEGGLNTIITALMVLLAAHFSKDKATISMLIAAKGVGTFLVLYGSGLLSDKFGRKSIMFPGALCFVVFTGGMMLTKSYNVALVLSFIGGVGHGLMDAPGLSIMFDVHKDKAGPYLSLIQAFFGGGGMFTSFVASILINNGISYKVIFGFYLVVAVLLSILVLVSKYPTIEKVQEGATFIKMFEKQPTVMREGLMLGVVIFVFSYFSYVFYTWLPTYMGVAKGFSEADGVTALLMCQIGGVIGSFIFSYLLRFTHPTIFMVANPIVGAVLLVLVYIIKIPLLLYALIFFTGFFLGLFFTMAISMGGELFPEKAGSASGAIGSASMLAGTVMVAISGNLVGSLGVEFIMQVTVFALMIVAALSYVFRKQYVNLGKRVFEV